MSAKNNKVVDNSAHYRFDEASKKFICSFCNRIYAKSTLNVNAKAAHLSDNEFAEKYQISLCEKAPIDVIDSNLAYLRSIKDPKANYNKRLTTLTQKTDNEISVLTDDIVASTTKVICPNKFTLCVL